MEVPTKMAVMIYITAINGGWQYKASACFTAVVPDQ